MGKILLFAFFSVSILFLIPRAQAVPTNPGVRAVWVGKITQIKGKVWIAPDPEGKNKTEAKEGTVIYSTDLLTTGSDSQALIVVYEKGEKSEKVAAILAKQNSSLKFSQGIQNSWVIDLNQGMLLSHVKPRSNPPRRFQIKTRSADMGVRGTTFFIKDDPKQDLFLCTCDGLVSIDDKVLVLGKNHNAPKLISSGSETIGKRLKNTEKGSDHSESEAAALVALLR